MKDQDFWKEDKIEIEQSEFIDVVDLPDLDEEIFSEHIHVTRAPLPKSEEDVVRSTQQEITDQLLAEMASLKKRLYEVEERLSKLENK